MANQKDGGNLSPVDVLKETEDYVQGSDLVSLFRGMAIETFKARPEKPATFLIDYLSRLYPSSAESVFSRMGRTSEGGVTSSSGCPAVTVYHGDAREHDYLVNKVKLEELTICVAEALISQRPKPEDSLECIIQTLQDIQQQRKEESLVPHEAPGKEYDGGD